jgi:multidrug transporter EmrE-like cation transporter
MKLKNLLFLLLGYLLYSLIGVISKSSHLHPLISFRTLFSYSIVLIFLGLYALIWQISIKKIPLYIAYMGKSICFVLTLFWSNIFFNEVIKINNIVGAILVILGILLMFSPKENTCSI